MKIVFYDKMDNDGRGARAVFELAHKNENVLYIGLDRDMKNNDKIHWIDILKDAPNNLVDKEVVFLDLAPREEKECVALQLLKNALIIDHHKLKYNPLDYGVKYIYKDGVSACMLTWEHFNPNKSAPYVVELINDRDIWANKMQPHTNYFHNVNEMMNERELLEVISMDITPPNSNFYESKLFAWLAVGAIREESNQEEIKEELANMKFSTLFGVKMAYTENKINYDILSQLGNEACALFKDKIDIYAHVYQKKSGEWSYSMRSLNGQAKKIILDNNLSGGGHDNACGFRDDRYLVGS